jgi:apolipoprotein N-acyltransferase
MRFPALLGFASGLLLFAADHPLHLWPLGAFALVPALVTSVRHCQRARQGALAGFALGIGYTIPLEAVLRFPLPVALGLGAYLVLVWVLWGIAAQRLMRWPAPWGALSVAATSALLEAAQTTLVPMWGTAQSFVRTWSAAPAIIQFVAGTGMIGLVFAVVALQALAVAWWLEPQHRRRHAIALAGLLLALLVGDALLSPAQPSAWLRVAAIGWDESALGRRGIKDAEELYGAVYEPLVARAAEQHAALVASPETGFVFEAGEVQAWMARFSLLARTRAVALAVGYFHRGESDNRVALFSAQGELRGEYRKTHLIPLYENYRAGDGELLLTELAGARVGAMICQDDNFTDLARAYGREGANLVVVPTRDWPEVKEYHLENSLFRPLENHYALVRAASNGVSVVVGPDGAVLARADGTETETALAIADVPLGTSGTPFSTAANFFVAACAALLLGCLWRQRRPSG